MENIDLMTEKRKEFFEKNIDWIFEKQKSFFLDGKTLDIKNRINALKKLKKVLKKNEDEIFKAIKSDLGKSEFESYTTELYLIYEEINSHIKNLNKWSKRKKVKSPIVHFPSKSYIYKEPYGVVLIIGPFNYPLQLTLAPLVGAISAGNTVMVKPSEASEKTSNIIKKIIQEAFSEEYVSWIDPTKGKQVVEKLLTLRFDYIFFTGSVNVGKIIMREAAKYITPVTLELGGKSPCIVDNDAKIELAAKRIVWGKFLNCGQTCVAPDYVYVHKDVKEKFLSKLVDEIKLQYGEDSSKSDDYPRIINLRELNRLIGLIDSRKVYFGGRWCSKDKYLQPTILNNITWNDKIMTQEIFGPILPIIDFKDIDDILNEISIREKPLALYYFSEDERKIRKVLEKTTSGGVTINDTIIHVSSNYLPFGGVGNSGIGKYHGKSSFDLFSHNKSVLVRGTWIEFNIRYAPFNNKIKLVKKLIK